MTTDALPWRIRSSTLAIVVLCAATALILTAAIARADAGGMKLITNWVNFGGAALTFAGLLYASLRSSVAIHNWFRRIIHRLRYGRRNVTISAEMMVSGAGYGYANLTVRHSFTVADRQQDPITQLLARTDSLLTYVNNLEQSVSDAHGKIHSVEMAVNHARAEAAKGDERTLGEATAALQRFADAVKRSDALDLRWAIAGTFFQAFGAVLSFYT